MRFLRTTFLILLIQIACVYASEASTIGKDIRAAEPSHIVGKKPKGKERNKIVIHISKEVGNVIITILEVVAEVCANNSGCSSYYRYNH